MYVESIAFVGGICSKEVADKLAKLVVMLDTWRSSIVWDCLPLIDEQTGRLADFAACIFHRQCFELAVYASLCQ